MLTALDLSHVRALDPGEVGQRFLGDALTRSLFANSRSERDGWFRLVGCRANGSASLNWTLLLHWRKRGTQQLYKPR